MALIVRFLRELRRRQVIGVAVIYVAAAWVVIQVVDTLPNLPVFLSVTNVFNAALIGFPLALVAGWYYDVTTKGISRTAPRDANDRFDTTLRPRDYALLLALVITWGVMVALVYVPSPSDRSIAVITFENRSHDPENAVLARGLQSDLQSYLERLPGLTIIAPESVTRLDADLSSAEIGETLNVAYLLRGAVDRIGDRIRVSALVVSTRDDHQVWSNNWDYELKTESLFEIRSAIANAVTNELRLRLSAEREQVLEYRPTDNLEAWEAYQLGLLRLDEGTTDSAAEATRYFEQALGIDPEFAEAYVGIANSLHWSAMLGGHAVIAPGVEPDPRVIDAVEKALRLNTYLGSAHIARGDLKWHLRDLDGAWKDFERGISLEPGNASAYATYALDLGWSDPAAALEVLQPALVLDPINPYLRSAAGRLNGVLGNREAAIAQFEMALEIEPGYARAYSELATVLAFRFGEVDSAVRYVSKAISSDPSSGWYWHMLSYYSLALGDVDTAIGAAKRYLQLEPTALKAHSAMVDIALQASELDHARNSLAALRDHYPTSAETAELEIDLLVREARLDDALQALRSKYAESEAVLIRSDEELWWAVTVGQLETIVAGRYLEAALEYEQENSTPTFKKVEILAWLGRTDEAVVVLELAMAEPDSLFWAPGALEHPLAMAPLDGDPRFEAIRDKIRAESGRQLDRVRKWRKSGEISLPSPL